MKADKKTLTRLYVDQGLSLREIAERLGLHQATVHYHLKRHGIELRGNAKRSRLRTYRLETLEKGIGEKGVRGYARELGIHENTLRHYLKRAKGAL
jgi:IS30 family transposase